MPGTAPRINTDFTKENIKIGPAYIYWNGRHIGHTYGGVSISITQNVYELKSDQYGEIPLKVIDAGIRIEVTANFTEHTFANLQILFSTGTLVVGNNDYMTFGKPVGSDEVSSGILIIEPTDSSEPFIIYNAAANIGEAMEIGFTVDNQRVYACKFVGLIDDARTSGDQLFRIGGYSSGLVFDLANGYWPTPR